MALVLFSLGKLLFFLDKLPVQVLQTCFVYRVMVVTVDQITARKLTSQEKGQLYFLLKIVPSFILFCFLSNLPADIVKSVDLF